MNACDDQISFYHDARNAGSFTYTKDNTLIMLPFCGDHSAKAKAVIIMISVAMTEKTDVNCDATPVNGVIVLPFDGAPEPLGIATLPSAAGKG